MYFGEEILISVDSEPWSLRTNIYLAIRDREGLKVAKPVEIIFEPLEEEGLDFDPVLTMNNEFAYRFFQALAEALDKEGIKTDKDAKLEGTLEATRYHLEDLRKLLKIE